MKRRRHHNNKGTQRTKVDKRQFEVDQMARKIFGKKMRRVPSKLFTIKEKS
jgi:hypothetical protein